MSLSVLEQLRAGKLQGARRVGIACGLRDFPREVFDLADSLEILDLSGNALSTLPDDLPRLHRLRIIFCSDNQFTELPKVLGLCPQLTMVGFKANQIAHVPPEALPPGLRWLVLTDNRIRHLPQEIGRCTQLQKLMLAGNELSTLPDSLTDCTRLELLRIAANRFESLPACIFRLPGLAWLAFGGNPCSDVVEMARVAQSEVKEIAWADLCLGQKLGEGASGIIHQARWQSSSECREVAVKLFKGAMTSDGLPHTEMNACLSGGDHPHMIPILGRLTGQPEQTPGLVMALISPDYRNLAGPPSLDSCTRDIYGADKIFSLGMALELALGLASAAKHLHQQGILHGDFYGHNVLHCERGRVVLGDFGAASFFEPESPVALPLQQMETLAFARLLEELLDRVRPQPGDQATLGALRQLQTRCANPDGGARPLFGEICLTLEALRLEESTF